MKFYHKTFRDLLKYYDRHDLFKYLNYFHDHKLNYETRGAYLSLIETLLNYEKKDFSDHALSINFGFDGFGAYLYTHVELFNLNYENPPENTEPWGGYKGCKIPEGHYDCNDLKYNKFLGILGNWEELLDCPIVVENEEYFNQLCPDDDYLLATILWEISFYGYTPKEVDDFKDMIFKRMNEALENI